MANAPDRFDACACAAAHADLAVCVDRLASPFTEPLPFALRLSFPMHQPGMPEWVVESVERHHRMSGVWRSQGWSEAHSKP